MTQPSTDVRLSADASELTLSNDSRYACETYIFEPSNDEKTLGSLYAVGETEERDGVGRELLDLVVQALQREYYRQPSRGVLASFESALHQANLVLHDAAEQGIRDWMGYFHMSVAVLADTTVHVSTAGFGSVFLARSRRVTPISKDLSHSPITNPLRTFAQVASGTTSARDVIFLNSSHFNSLFRPEDLSRFAIDHSASTITTRLQQLYSDQGSQVPLCTIVISILPQHIAASSTAVTPSSSDPSPARSRRLANTLNPRSPITIHRSVFRSLIAITVRLFSSGWRQLITKIWPALKKGSRSGGRAMAKASVSTTKNVQSLTTRGLGNLKNRRAQANNTSTDSLSSPRFSPAKLAFRPPPLTSLAAAILTAPRRFIRLLASLPRASKVFAVITIILIIALTVSLMLLQQKKDRDADIQRASEILHDARTKQAAAETALIYDNRDQARNLLDDANLSLEELRQTDLYVTEVSELSTSITTINDRLQRVVRASAANTAILGDLSSAIDSSNPTNIIFVNDIIYTFDPATNTIISMNQEGAATRVNETTEGIGFLTDAVAHPADKNIIFATDTPGIALFDSKDNSLTNQEVSFFSPEPSTQALATFGNRLYLLDQTAGNIFSYNKTLRGYSGGTPWIADENFSVSTIIDFAIDGSIYTLHSDGSIQELFKGEPAEFTLESVDPPLTTATNITTTEDLDNLYVLDVANHRVVIFNKKGQLQRQLFLDVAHSLQDIAISPDETTLYALDGTRVLSIPLEQPE